MEKDTGISRRFREGLAEYNLSPEEITNGSWKYAGGTNERHRKYFQTAYKEYDLPDVTDKCICGHPIKENCFIYNKETETFLIMGNCCIKRFLPTEHSGRTCSICEKPHRNRKDNLCNSCRYKEANKIIKVFLIVPYERKDEAKKLGAKWDKEERKWYAERRPGYCNLGNYSLIIQKFKIVDTCKI